MAIGLSIVDCRLLIVVCVGLIQMIMRLKSSRDEHKANDIVDWEVFSIINQQSTIINPLCPLALPKKQCSSEFLKCLLAAHSVFAIFIPSYTFLFPYQL